MREVAMRYTVSSTSPGFGEIGDLLDAASFSLETAQMALAIGRRCHSSYLSLDDRLATDDEEESEAAGVALEALAAARAAFVDLAEVLAEPPLEGLGLEARFWSCYAWCASRLFSDTVRYTGQLALKHELVEARRRTQRLADHLAALLGHSERTH